MSLNPHRRAARDALLEALGLRPPEIARVELDRALGEVLDGGERKFLRQRLRALRDHLTSRHWRGVAECVERANQALLAEKATHRYDGKGRPR